jgi:hypothetical protein
MHETQDKAKPPVIELRKFLRSIVQFFMYLKYNTQNKYLPVYEEPKRYNTKEINFLLNKALEKITVCIVHFNACR